MSLSAPQQAVLRGLRDLEAADGRDAGWDKPTVQVAAGRYPGGKKVTDRTLGSLQTRCAIYAGALSRGKYVLTEAGRQRIASGR